MRSSEYRGLNRVQHRVLSRVLMIEYGDLSRAYLVPHRPTANRHPLTARVHPAREVGTSVPAGPGMSDARPTEDGQPYLKRQSTDYGLQSTEYRGQSTEDRGQRTEDRGQRTEYGVLNRLQSRVCLVPHLQTANRQPLTARVLRADGQLYLIETECFTGNVGTLRECGWADRTPHLQGGHENRRDLG